MGTWGGGQQVQSSPSPGYWVAFSVGGQTPTPIPQQPLGNRPPLAASQAKGLSLYSDSPGRSQPGAVLPPSDPPGQATAGPSPLALLCLGSLEVLTGLLTTGRLPLAPAITSPNSPGHLTRPPPALGQGPVPRTCEPGSCRDFRASGADISDIFSSGLSRPSLHSSGVCVSVLEHLSWERSGVQQEAGSVGWP